MNTTSFPPDSLHARLHGTAPARAAPIPIPRDIAVAWSPQAISVERHDPRVKYVSAAIVLFVAIAAAAIVLA